MFGLTGWEDKQAGYVGISVLFLLGDELLAALCCSYSPLFLGIFHEVKRAIHDSPRPPHGNSGCTSSVILD